MAEVRDAHASYYAKALFALKDHIVTSQVSEISKKIATDFENIERAWDWAIQFSYHSNIEQMLVTLSEYYRRWKLFDKYKTMIESAYAKFGDSENPNVQNLRGRLIRRFANINYPPEERRKLFETALSIARDHQDIELMCRCLESISIVLENETKYDMAHIRRRSHLKSSITKSTA